MSLYSNILENPPAYKEPTNEVWEPAILILADTTIYAESTDSAPLYRLSRAVATLTASTKEVEFERVEHTVEAKFDEPVVKPRSRHIYTLKYMTKVPGGLGARVDGWESPNVFIQSVSRRTMGHLGVKRSRFRPQKGLKVLPIDVSGKDSSFGSLPSFDKYAKPLFQIQPKDDGANVWTDGDGKALAVEDRGEGQDKLIITASLHRETVDALVALWCGRIWQCSDENADPLEEGLDGVRRKFRLAKEIQATSKTMRGFGV
ncbi:hypothetical protein DM02DRAFT_618000 [Periconia macrospinosa]|uniref:Uncharacterized protein n=1 Tax=Periconia macrospinosa TaxID=97972 RepID=A0A2V1DDW3_9PLEO|nr:hypothetical protein DM02DRAFT_618000 [Periconia macrospinosa]